MDLIVQASVCRLTATNFRISADVLYKEMRARGEVLPRNVRAIPFYYLMSHAMELLLKAALLKRGVEPAELRKQHRRHRLDVLLELLVAQSVSVSQKTGDLIKRLSEQHATHALRYTALRDDGEVTFTPEPSAIIEAYDELLLAGKTGGIQ